MADKCNKRSLAREGEQSKKTEKGLEIPELKPLITLVFHES